MYAIHLSESEFVPQTTWKLLLATKAAQGSINALCELRFHDTKGAQYLSSLRLEARITDKSVLRPSPSICYPRLSAATHEMRFTIGFVQGVF